MKLDERQLPCGLNFFTDSCGARVCTGAQMGRPSLVPIDPNAAPQFQLVRLSWVDGDYDLGGAYWGGGTGDHIYWAKASSEFPLKFLTTNYQTDSEGVPELFIRARSKREAWRKILTLIPRAKLNH